MLEMTRSSWLADACSVDRRSEPGPLGTFSGSENGTALQFLEHLNTTGIYINVYPMPGTI